MLVEALLFLCSLSHPRLLSNGLNSRWARLMPSLHILGAILLTSDVAISLVMYLAKFLYAY